MHGSPSHSSLPASPPTLQTLPTAQISSSLAFQTLLYLNTFLSLVYALSNMSLCILKLYHFKFTSNLQEVLLLPTFLIWGVGEMSRTYFGYVGNLKELVPQMSAFLLTTIFPQLPCVVYLAYYQEFLMPFDLAVGSIMLGVIVVELGVGYVTLHGLIERQTSQFYRLCQEEEDAYRSRLTG